MPIEIERKFLVTNLSFLDVARDNIPISQGFLSSHPDRMVRVRIAGNDAFLTIKGKGNDSGASRFEWEKPITVDEANQLMELCEPGIIEKTRYLVPAGTHTIEVDVFHGENAGLILAEVEMVNETDDILLPDWVGREVTGEERYYNDRLSRMPFRQWK
jgi:CYTH domain-containing protein